MKSIIIISFLVLVCLTNSNAQSIQEARKFTDNEQYENASVVYKMLISKDPKNVIYYYYYADNLLLSDNPDSARIIFEKGGTLDGINPLIKIGKAKILLDKINERNIKIIECFIFSILLIIK